MAVVVVRMVKGPGTDSKRKLAEALTAAVAETLDVARTSVTVLIEDYERENWAVGGELDSDRRGGEKAPDIEAYFRKPVAKPAEKSAEKKPLKASPRKAPAKSRSRR